MEPTNYPTPQPQQDEDISLRELIYRVKDYYTELRKYRKILVFCVLGFVAVFGYIAWTKAVTYTATLTFMLNDEQGGAGIASVLGQFGSLLGGVGNGDYQLEKIMEIARSRRVISSALFKKYELEGQSDYYANHLIRVQNLHKKWKKDSLLKDFVFPTGNPDKFDRKENKALLSLYQEMIGGEDADYPMLTTRIDKKAGIMTLLLKSRNEMFSIGFVNTLYEEISSFYIEKSIEREQVTFAILEHKRDSIGQALNRNDYASATFEDKNNNILLQQDRIPSKAFQRNNQLLSIVYGEAIKNTEMAEFALKSNTPFLSLIDMPIPPIKPDSRGRIKAILTGLILGFTLGAVYIIGRKMVRVATA